MMVLLGTEDGRYALDKGVGKKLKMTVEGRIFHPPTCE
jgi:hypothetical protein